jgi:hypothetical protein
MSKSFIIQRDVLTQVWVKQLITVDNVDDIGQAINEVKQCSEDILYAKFDVDSETLYETESIISSQINTSNCYEIPNQSKLDF